MTLRFFAGPMVTVWELITEQRFIKVFPLSTWGIIGLGNGRFLLSKAIQSASKLEEVFLMTSKYVCLLRLR
jgi:hypothetical protein